MPIRFVVDEHTEAPGIVTVRVDDRLQTGTDAFSEVRRERIGRVLGESRFVTAPNVQDFRVRRVRTDIVTIFKKTRI